MTSEIPISLYLATIMSQKGLSDSQLPVSFNTPSGVQLPTSFSFDPSGQSAPVFHSYNNQPAQYNSQNNYGFYPNQVTDSKCLQRSALGSSSGFRKRGPICAAVCGHNSSLFLTSRPIRGSADRSAESGQVQPVLGHFAKGLRYPAAGRIGTAAGQSTLSAEFLPYSHFHFVSGWSLAVLLTMSCM